MRYTESDIKQEILNAWDYLADSRYPEDLLAEWADSAVPIYTEDIISEWQEMPSEYDDSWQDYTEATNSMGIADLMKIDLYAYYSDTYTRIYREVSHDKDTE